MRNAMICVSVMLALFLGWPLAFGGREPAQFDTSRAEARPVAAAQPQPALGPAAAVLEGARPESCYARFQRENRVCPNRGSSGAACRQQAADHWDLCEARGFWPD